MLEHDATLVCRLCVKISYLPEVYAAACHHGLLQAYYKVHIRPVLRRLLSARLTSLTLSLLCKQVVVVTLKQLEEKGNEATKEKSLIACWRWPEAMARGIGFLPVDLITGC